MRDRLELRAALAAPIALGLLAIAPAIMCLKAPTVGLSVFGGALAIALLWLAIGLGRRKLILDDAGVTSRGVFGAKTLRWDDVDHYTFWSMSNQYGYYYGGAQAGVAGAIAVAVVLAVFAASRKKGPANRRFAQGRMTLRGKGAAIAIDLRYKNADEALDRAFAEVHERLRRRRVVDFSPFLLDETELSHATKGRIGLPDIEKVGAAGARIAIRKRGKRLAWARVAMRRTKNSIFFLEQLAERGVPVTAQDEVFMPPSIADKLRAAVARDKALPKARVVIRD